MVITDNTNILIIGASGFLGQGLARYCSVSGLTVIGLDIVAPVDNNHIKFFHLVDCLEDELGALLVKYQPCFLVNLAGNADVKKSMAEPLHDFKHSVQLFSVILESVRHFSPTTKILLSSSAAVYGQPTQLPISEKDRPNPISPYGYHKWMCELMANEYSSIYGIKTISMRIFSAYGIGLKKQILWDLCCKCQSGNDIELGGDGSETRDFIHLNDACTAALCLLREEKYNSGVYNVASGEEVSIQALARLVLEEFGIEEHKLKFSGESRIGDPKNWRADINKLKVLGYTPAIKLESGIREYVKWFKTIN